MCGSNDGNSKEDTRESQEHEIGEIERCVESDGCGRTTEGYEGETVFILFLFRRVSAKD